MGREEGVKNVTLISGLGEYLNFSRRLFTAMFTRVAFQDP